MGNGYVLELDIEFLGALQKIGSDAVGDGLSLGDEFSSIELGNNRFENFVSNGRKYTLVVIKAKILCTVRYIVVK